LAYVKTIEPQCKVVVVEIIVLYATSLRNKLSSSSQKKIGAFRLLEIQEDLQDIAVNDVAESS
jgi:hypothetical protein